jgi:integrase/recombinase XerD
MILQEAIDRYTQDLTLQNASPQTIHCKIALLKQFKAFCAQKGIESIEQITPQALDEYRLFQFERVNVWGRRNSPSGYNNLLIAVKTLLAYLHEQELIPNNPGTRLKLAKMPQHLPSGVLSPQEIRRMLHTPDLSTVKGWRDRAMLELLWSAAPRVHELTDLSLEDVDLDNGLLYIRKGKGNKDRVSILGKMAVRYLGPYILKIRPRFAHDCPYLFPNLRGGHMSTVCVGKLVKKYASKAGIAKRVHPHCFRASAATAMLRKGANLRVLQSYLGHARLNTLQHYLSLTVDDLKKAHNRCHPRNRDAETFQKVPVDGNSLPA